MKLINHYGGWIPDRPDQRDRVFYGGWTSDGSDQHADHTSAFQQSPARLVIPPKVDLRDKFHEPYDQGELGSCTANAIAAAVQYERSRQSLQPDFIPSRLFIYFNERTIEGTVGSDSGAMIRDGIKSVARFGDCPETEWEYNISQFSVTPPKQCFGDAIKYKALDYWRVPRELLQIRGCLAAGFPIVFGFSVYESFEGDAVTQSGIVPMPVSSERLLGGHAVLAVGYDDATQRLTVRNSWGQQWGDKGYFYLPYDFMLDENLSDDFWTLKIIAS